jgi:hypothetical protein
VADPSAPDPLLDTAAAAKHLKVSPSFLAKLRMKGTGPAYSKFDKLVRYRLASLDQYELEHRRTSTAEELRLTGLVPKASAAPERQQECLAGTRLRRGSRSARGPP